MKEKSTFIFAAYREFRRLRTEQQTMKGMDSGGWNEKIFQILSSGQRVLPLQSRKVTAFHERSEAL